MIEAKQKTIIDIAKIFCNSRNYRSMSILKTAHSDGNNLSFTDLNVSVQLKHTGYTSGLYDLRCGKLYPNFEDDAKEFPLGVFSIPESKNSSKKRIPFKFKVGLEQMERLFNFPFISDKFNTRVLVNIERQEMAYTNGHILMIEKGEFGIKSNTNLKQFQIPKSYFYTVYKILEKAGLLKNARTFIHMKKSEPIEIEFNSPFCILMVRINDFKYPNYVNIFPPTYNPVFSADELISTGFLAEIKKYSKEFTSVCVHGEPGKPIQFRLHKRGSDRSILIKTDVGHKFKRYFEASFGIGLFQYFIETGGMIGVCDEALRNKFEENEVSWQTHDRRYIIRPLDMGNVSSYYYWDNENGTILELPAMDTITLSNGTGRKRKQVTKPEATESEEMSEMRRMLSEKDEEIERLRQQLQEQNVSHEAEIATLKADVDQTLKYYVQNTRELLSLIGVLDVTINRLSKRRR